jgi:hypothetical protein
MPSHPSQFPHVKSKEHKEKRSISRMKSKTKISSLKLSQHNTCNTYARKWKTHTKLIATRVRDSWQWITNLHKSYGKMVFEKSTIPFCLLPSIKL